MPKVPVFRIGAVEDSAAPNADRGHRRCRSARMRPDGTALTSDAFRPDATRPFPTDKENHRPVRRRRHPNPGRRYPPALRRRKRPGKTGPLRPSSAAFRRETSPVPPERTVRTERRPLPGGTARFPRHAFRLLRTKHPPVRLHASVAPLPFPPPYTGNRIRAAETPLSDRHQTPRAAGKPLAKCRIPKGIYCPSTR